MILNMNSFRVQEVRFGAETAFAKGILTINRKELQTLLVAGRDALESVDVALARPGDRTRIIRILDAVEPRTKLDKDASPLSRFSGPSPSGRTRFHRQVSEYGSHNQCFISRIYA